MSWFGPQQGGRRGRWQTSPSLLCRAIPPSAKPHGNPEQLSTQWQGFLVCSQTGKDFPDRCVVIVYMGYSGSGRNLLQVRCWDFCIFARFRGANLGKVLSTVIPGSSIQPQNLFLPS